MNKGKHIIGNKNRDLTMNDIRNPEPFKDKFYMQGKKDNVEADISGNKLIVDYNHEGLDEQSKAALIYNSRIEELDELYSSFIPARGNILIRYYARPPQESSIVGPNGKKAILPPLQSPYDSVALKAKHQSQYVHSYAENPFLFNAKAVVVASSWDEIKVGDIIATEIPRPNSIISGTTDTRFMVYSNWFVHPDSGLMSACTKIGDRHFGYSLGMHTLCRGFLKKVDNRI